MSPKRLIACVAVALTFAACADPPARVTSPRKSLPGKSHPAVEVVWATPEARARDLKLWDETRWYDYWTDVDRWEAYWTWVLASGPHGDGTVNGYPCGDQLPPCYVLERESKGTPTAQNPISSASGLWQFLDSTWAGFGGYAHAKDAPASVQNERAAEVWAGGAGASNWACC